MQVGDGGGGGGGGTFVFYVRMSFCQLEAIL